MSPFTTVRVPVAGYVTIQPSIGLATVSAAVPNIPYNTATGSPSRTFAPTACSGRTNPPVSHTR